MDGMRLCQCHDWQTNLYTLWGWEDVRSLDLSCTTPEMTPTLQVQRHLISFCVEDARYALCFREKEHDGKVVYANE